MEGKARVAVLGLIVGLVVLVWAYGNLWATPRVVVDDFDDGDTATTVPPDPGDTVPVRWVFTSPSSPNSLTLEASTLWNGDTYSLRWEPTGIYQNNPSAIAEGLDSAFDYPHWTPSLITHFDECWYLNDGDTDGTHESRPQFTMDYNILMVSSGSTYEEPTALRFTRDAATHGTYADMFLWYWWFPLEGNSVEWPEGYEPVIDGGTGHCYRYYFSIDLDCNSQLKAVELNSSGNETANSYVLWEDTTNCMEGLTIGGDTIAQNALGITGIEFGAERTDDGYDANVDNVQLWSLATDWDKEHPENFDHYVDLRDVYNLMYGKTVEAPETLPTSGTGDTVLSTAIDYCTHIYLPKPPNGYAHKVDNPVVVDRDYPFFMVSSNYMDTMISAKNNTKGSADYLIGDTTLGDIDPLFVFKDATVVNFTNVGLYPSFPSVIANDTICNARAIVADNEEPLRLELLHAKLKSSMLDIKGPGDYIVQGSILDRYRHTSHSVLLDSETAVLYFIGGSLDGNSVPLYSEVTEGVDPCPIYQQHGRVAAYIWSTHNAQGSADICVETASAVGVLHDSDTVMPHTIVAGRQERPNNLPSSLVSVKESDEAVDLLVMANRTGAGITDPQNYSMVHYNADGTIWLIGNNGLDTTGYLVTGNSIGDDAKIVAYGNYLHGYTTECENYVYDCDGSTCTYDGNTIYTGDDYKFIKDGDTCTHSGSSVDCHADSTCVYDSDSTQVECNGCHRYSSYCTYKVTSGSTVALVTGTTCIITNGNTVITETGNTCENLPGTKSYGSMDTANCYRYIDVWDGSTWIAQGDTCSCRWVTFCDCDFAGYACTREDYKTLECVSPKETFNDLFSDSVQDHATILQAGNMYYYKQLFSNMGNPQKRLFPQTSTIPSDSISNFYLIDAASGYTPDFDIPDAVLPEELKLTVPQMNFALPDMIDVSDPNALGTCNKPAVEPNSSSDQRDKIQEILNTCPGSNKLFFPAGTYRLSQPLMYWYKIGTNNYGDASPNGGWISGAGLEDSTYLSVLQSASTLDGYTPGVFWSGGNFAFKMITGMKFENIPYVFDSDTSDEYPTFSVDRQPGVGWAPQHNYFDQCSFSGGLFGMAMGPLWAPSSTTSQCSETLMVNSEFNNAKYGYKGGHANALDNIIIDGKFDGNYTVGYYGVPFHVLRANITNTEYYDIDQPTGDVVEYLYGLKSTSPKFYKANYGGTSWIDTALFDGCSLAPGSTAGISVLSEVGGGPIFLHSKMEVIAGDTNTIRVVPSGRQGFLFNLQSDLEGWYSSTIVNANAQAFRVSKP